MIDTTIVCTRSILLRFFSVGVLVGSKISVGKIWRVPKNLTKKVELFEKICRWVPNYPKMDVFNPLPHVTRCHPLVPSFHVTHQKVTNSDLQNLLKRSVPTRWFGAIFCFIFIKTGTVKKKYGTKHVYDRYSRNEKVSDITRLTDPPFRT